MGASPSGPASEGDPLYMMKNVPMSGESGPGSSGGEGGPQNGGPDLDNMKSSPTTAPTTPREGDQNLEFNMPNFPPGGENNESEAILKIKESMQEEAKRFEKGSDGASDFFMP